MLAKPKLTSSCFGYFLRCNAMCWIITYHLSLCYLFTGKFWQNSMNGFDLCLNLSLTSLHFLVQYNCRPAPLSFRRSRIQLWIISIQLSMWTICCFLGEEEEIIQPTSICMRWAHCKGMTAWRYVAKMLPRERLILDSGQTPVAINVDRWRLVIWFVSTHCDCTAEWHNFSYMPCFLSSGFDMKKRHVWYTRSHFLYIFCSIKLLIFSIRRFSYRGITEYTKNTGRTMVE